MYKYIKHFLDVIIAIVLLFLFSPIFIVIAILIKLESRGPIIFKQERLGYKGKVFKIYKFRSMVQGAEKQGTGVYSFKGDSRITKVGRFIRATSIDELPQLFNIIKGDMALIGPRPALTYHPWPFDQYTEHQKRMFDVRPGVTGWAQVNGRNAISWTKKFQPELNIVIADIEYVEKMSFGFDLKIFFMTIFKVLVNANNNNIEKTN